MVIKFKLKTIIWSNIISFKEKCNCLILNKPRAKVQTPKVGGLGPKKDKIKIEHRHLPSWKSPTLYI